jgi:uncharacterized protein involved in exopolysaccharide biosynthesis
METQPKDVSHYIGLIKLRKYYMLIPLLFIFIVSTIVSFVLPPVYKSTTTILIEGQQIPADLVRTTVTTVVEQAIQTITQQIMSRTKLLEIIDRFELYQDRRAIETTEEIVDRMREDIKLETISADIIDQRTGRASVATIAFNLSYEFKDPQKVMKVANTLASLFLEQNLKDREERAKTTSSFIEAELNALNENINQLEAKIAEFKQKHFQALPAMTELNFQMIQRLERQVEDVQNQINNIKERKIYLDGQLAGIDPDLPGIKGTDGRMADAKQTLKYLYTEYTTLKASLSDKHPDLIKMKKEIDSLEKEVTLKDEIQLKQNQLEALKTDLAIKKGKFSEKHPDIIKLKKSIAILENEIKEKVKDRGKMQSEAEAPENPAYINISTQIDTAKMEIEALKEEQERLKAKLEDYQKRLELTPQIELEYNLLTRDYENSRARYQETLNKLMVAKSGEGLEKGQKGQKFTIIDPAIFPEKPYKPNRLIIILVGFVLGLGAGAGIATIKEFSDQSIRSEEELSFLTGRPVLAAISLMETEEDLKRKKRKLKIFIISVLAIMGLFVLAVHLFYKPLDVLWFVVLQKLAKLRLM